MLLLANSCLLVDISFLMILGFFFHFDRFEICYFSFICRSILRICAKDQPQHGEGFWENRCLGVAKIMSPSQIMDPCWWPVFIWSSCSKLFIFMFCFPSRDFSVYILFAWYSKWALYQCLAWFFVSVLQAVFSFFPKRILISYITQIQSLTLHINPVIYPWFPFDYLMNQHPTIPAI